MEEWFLRALIALAILFLLWLLFSPGPIAYIE